MFKEEMTVKKLVVIMLILFTILASAVSFAAQGSKENQNISGGTVEEESIEIIKTTDTESTKSIKDLLIKAQKAGNVLDAFPQEIKDLIPEENTEVNEMETVRLVGDLTGLKELTLTYKFETPYKLNEKVTVVLGIPSDTEESGIEWTVLEGVGDKDGNVVFTIDKETLEKVQNNPFVIIPVSKKK